jgi:predicted Zn finger-like uncharacterized protein
MGLKTTCSNCGASFAMKNRDLEGKKVKCKKCGDPFVVKFSSGSGNGGGGMSAAGGLPPKVVGQKPPRKVKPQTADEEPAPSKSQGGSGNKKIFIIGGSVLGLLVVWTGIMFVVGSGGEKKTTAPQQVQLELTRGQSELGRFAVDYPVGWEFKTAGGSGGIPESILIKGEDVSISIRTDLGASAVGDIVSGGGTIQDEEMPEELEPIAQVHEFMKSELQSEMNSYDEDPPEKVMAKAGNSRLSKFVGDRGLLGGGKAYGFRATLPGGTEKIKVKIICESQKVFDKYEQMLRKIVLSIGPP